MSYSHHYNEGRLVKRAYSADRVRALELGAVTEDTFNPLGQALAAIDGPFDFSPAMSQLQASALEVRHANQRQPPDAAILGQ